MHLCMKGILMANETQKKVDVNELIERGKAKGSLTNAEILEFSNVMLNDHMMSLRLNIKANVALSDTPTVLGRLAVEKLGIVETPYAIFYAPAISDLGNCTLSYRIDQNGEISVHEVLNVDGTHVMAAESTAFIHIVYPVKYDKMDNSFCDKFYWKRIK